MRTEHPLAASALEALNRLTPEAAIATILRYADNPDWLTLAAAGGVSPIDRGIYWFVDPDNDETIWPGRVLTFTFLDEPHHVVLTRLRDIVSGWEVQTMPTHFILRPEQHGETGRTAMQQPQAASLSSSPA